MFDFSLTEMMLAGVVALVVLGPERLPVVARKAGQWMAKIQSLAAGVRSELAAHAEVAELIKVKQELEETSAEIQQDLQNLSKQVEQNSQEIAEHLHDSVPAWELRTAPLRPPYPPPSRPAAPSARHTRPLCVNGLCRSNGICARATVRHRN